MNYKTQYKISEVMAGCAMQLVMLLMAAATAFAVVGSLVLAMGASVARSCALGDGPSPAAQGTSNMPQAGLTIHYNRVFMKWLHLTFNKLMMCTMMDLPEKSGQTFRNFMSIPLGADTTQQTEGTIGAPEKISVNYKDISIAQYANYTNISDLAFMTSISNDMEEYRKILAYQLGWTIDNLIMAMMNYLRTSDTRTANQDSTTSPFPFTKNIIEQMPASLSGATVLPMASGFYEGSIHPFFVGDLFIDNSNNSVIDIWKHTESGQAKLRELTDPGAKGDAPTQVMELSGAHWRQSTNQTQVANWQGGGTTAIYTYLAGADAMIFINFPNKRHTKIGHLWENLDLWAGPFPRSSFDPAGVIMAGTSYNCALGIGPPPDTTSRMRIAGAVPQTT